jgi:hypothetical protein
MISRFHRWTLSLSAVALCLAANGASSAEEFEQHEAHEHGKVTLNVAIESSRLTIELDSPAVNVVGFEHAPRTPEEKAAAKAADDFLKSGRGLFGVPPAAECRSIEVKLTPPHWEEESAAKHEEHEHHADYEAQFVYQCGAPAKLEWIEPWLLDKLRNVTEARVNTITSAGQRSQVVSRARARISLR